MPCGRLRSQLLHRAHSTPRRHHSRQAPIKNHIETPYVNTDWQCCSIVQEASSPTLIALARERLSSLSSSAGIGRVFSRLRPLPTLEDIASLSVPASSAAIEKELRHMLTKLDDAVDDVRLKFYSELALSQPRPVATTLEEVCVSH